MATPDLATLGLEIRSDGVVVANKRLRDMEKQAGKTERSTVSLGEKAERVGRKMRGFGKALSLGVTAPLAAAAAASVKLAVDAEETANKFNVVFRGSVESSRSELQKLTETIPLTRTQMEGLAAGIQDMLVPMGVARDQAAGMSVDMVKLAGDLASFNNVPTTRVLEAMQSALAGSSEPMRRFGVDTRVTRLEQIALRDGLIEAGDEMDNAAMAAATLTAVMEDSTDAMGDAERTVGSTANQMRFLQRDIRQLSEDIGKDLLPAARDLLSMLRGMTDSMSQMEPETRKLAIQIAAIAAAAGPLLIILGSMVTAINGLIPAVKRLRVALGPVGLAAAIGVELVRAIGEGIASFNRFDDIIEAHRKKLDEATRGVELFSDAWVEMRLSTMDVPATLAEVEAELDKVSTQLRQFRNKGVDETSAVMQVLIERQKELGDAFNLMSEEAEGAASSISTTSEELEEISSWAQRVSDSMRTSQITQYRDAMIGIAGALFSAVTGMRAFNAESNRQSGGGIFPDMGAVDSVLDGMKEIRKEVEEAAAIEWNFENLIDSFDPLSQAMRRLGDDIDLVNARIEKGSMSQMEGTFVKTGVAANAAFGAIMSGMDQASSEYRAMEVAQQAVNVALGIAAILQQGMGDPYTAIPRMIAMAAMVTQLVDGIGGLSGGPSGGAEQRQAAQGTGTVLGDAEAKSKSIENAIEITADATSELVGINRGMLQALKAMQAGIAGASNMIARGVMGFEVDLSGMGTNAFGKALQDIFDPIGGPLADLLGGKVKNIDEGLAIQGGPFDWLYNEVFARPFKEVAEKKNIFDDFDNKTIFGDFDEELGNQINLIFRSMADAVREGAKALGLAGSEVWESIQNFDVENLLISLKDLSAEEAQAELEAVFGSIFDDLVGAVIPFLDQFQKVGEGLGETLARVATSVQVTREAIKRLGLNIEDGLGPEKMAQVSVGLVEAAGGIDNFISQMESFINKFAPEAHQFAIAQSDITRALAQMNVELPESREGFWNLMQAIDGSTEAGQRQIATLLSLTDAADTFYSALEEMEQDRQQLLSRLAEINGTEEALLQRRIEAARDRTQDLMSSLGISANLDRGSPEDLARWFEILNERIGDADPAGFIEAGEALLELIELEERLADSRRQLTDFMESIEMAFLDATQPAMASLKRLVDRWEDMEKQAVELGASEDQLRRVRRAANAEMAKWISDMKLSTLQLAEDFFSVEQSFSQVGTSIGQTMDNMRDKVLRALTSIDEWLLSSQLDSNSPLTPPERLGEAESQFNQAFEAALAGDVEALESLPQLADQFLGEAGSFYGTSTDQFRAIWDQVQAMMRTVSENTEVPEEARPPTFGQIETLNTATSNFAANIANMEREIAAAQLADKINAIATATGSTPADIADELGFSQGQMKTILENLGVDITDVSAGNFTEFFNDSIRNLENGSPLLKALTGGQGSVTWAIGILEANLWQIGDVLVQILEQLGGTYQLPASQQGSSHQGGPINDTGLYNLTAGEFVVPRNGMISTGPGNTQDFAEVKMELNRISNLMERGNNDRRDGLGAVVNKQDATKRAIESKSQTARAV